MHLKTLLVAPPGGGGGWVYKQPESGLWMKGITFTQLLGRVSQHRTNMKYPYVNPPFATLAEEIEDWICQQMTPQDQLDKCDLGIRHKTSVHWQEVLDFLTATTKWLVGGKQTVSAAEAERRAAICASCPLNVYMHGCGICAATLEEFRTKMVGATTSKDEKLRACGVCSCDLKAIVHLPMDVLRKNRPMDFPAWCWQNAQSPAASSQSTEQTP